MVNKNGKICLEPCKIGPGPILKFTQKKELRQVIFSPTGHDLATVDWKSSVCLWSLPDGTSQEIPGVLAKYIAYSPDGQTIGMMAPLQLWNVATGTLVKYSNVPNSQRLGLICFSPDGTTIAAQTGDTEITLFDVSTHEAIRTFSWKKVPVIDASLSALAFSPDGATIATGGFGDIMRLWEVATGQERFPPLKHRGASGVRGASGGEYHFIINSVAFSPDSTTLASLSDDGTIKLWNLARGEELNELPVDISYSKSLAFSPDGRFLACGTLRRVILWDVQTYTRRLVLAWGSQMYSISFSLDGSMLAACNGKFLLIWKIANELS
jgi:WD40 repeat protein